MRRSFLASALIAGTLLVPAAAASASTDIVISEFRVRGPSGGNDEFIELRNTASSPVDISGWTVRGSNNAGTVGIRATIPANTAPLQPGGTYLLTNSQGYTGTVAGDQTYGTGITDDGGIAVMRPGLSSADEVGLSAGSAYREATPLASLGSSNLDRSYERKNQTQDTDVNANDFAVSTPSDPENRASNETPPEDDAPSVASSDPADGANDVDRDGNLTVTFCEPVTAQDDAFALTCGGTAVALAVTRKAADAYTLDPQSTLPVGASCSLAVEGDRYHDEDAVDPPDTGSDRTIRFRTLGLTGLRIRDIQGAAHVSPHVGDVVSGVEGVVTARRGNGFFIQDPAPDADPATSEGVFVFTSSTPRPEIAVGKAVKVSGTVSEFRGDGNALGMTQITGPTVTVVGDGPAIPATIIGEGGRVPPDRIIDNDSLGDVDVNPMFDPDEDGIDFYETLEGMKVQVTDPYVVGPTASFGEIPVVGDGGRFAGPFTARGGLLSRPDDPNPERIQLDDEVLRAQNERMPLANVRDRLSTVQGVVDYSFSNFKVQVLSPPTVTSGGLQKEVTEAPDDDELSVGSFNVENLTPLGANPSASQAAKYAALAETLVTRMKAPDIVAVEEIQDNDGTSGGTNSPVVSASQTWADLIAAIQAAGGPAYQYRQIDPVAHKDGGAPGGNIRVGFLFRTDRGLQFVDRPGGTSTNATQVVNTKQGPAVTYSPGRIQPGDDAWLASRKPLVGEFTWRGRTLFAIANHFASKGGDEPLFGHFQPPTRHTEIGPDGRHRQAELVNGFVRDLLAADKQARVVVMGDINDFDYSETVKILEREGALTTLFETLPQDERYSYVFEGNSQVLDQILVSPTLLHPSPEYDSVHMNAEFADQTSDHDPQVARLKLTGRLIPQNR